MAPESFQISVETSCGEVLIYGWRMKGFAGEEEDRSMEGSEEDDDEGCVDTGKNGGVHADGASSANADTENIGEEGSRKDEGAGIVFGAERSVEGAIDGEKVN